MEPIGLTELASLPEPVRSRIIAGAPDGDWDRTVTGVLFDKALAGRKQDLAILINVAFGAPAHDNHGSWMARKVAYGEDDEHGIALFHDDRLIAFAAYRTPSADSSCSSFGGRYPYVSNVVVDPLYRRHGVGREMIERLLDRLEAEGYSGAFTNSLAWEGMPYISKVDGWSPTWVISRSDGTQAGFFNSGRMDFESA